MAERNPFGQIHHESDLNRVRQGGITDIANGILEGIAMRFIGKQPVDVEGYNKLGLSYEDRANIYGPGTFLHLSESGEIIPLDIEKMTDNEGENPQLPAA